MSIAFPAAVAIIALACAIVVGWDALKRPRPERIIWFAAFLVFAVAAAAEVVGAAVGWTPALARLYYLAGAVTVVGLLALGEAYLLWPARMPALTPGIALLTVAIAATVVWSAPVDAARLPEAGWHAIERGPALVALAVLINAGGTVVLVGGALTSAAKIRARPGATRRAVGCVLIAAGAIVVALGGTLTRLGQPEYLYLAMSAGIGVIFAGVVLTRSVGERVSSAGVSAAESSQTALMSLPLREPNGLAGQGEEGLRFIVDNVLPLSDAEVADACRRWSATAIAGDALSREQAKRTWALRVMLAEPARCRFDCLPLVVQAQLAELYGTVWSADTGQSRSDSGAGARRSLAILPLVGEPEGEAR